MASGPPFGGNEDGSRENHRWTESKVYTRKSHNKGGGGSSKKSLQQPHSQTLAASEDGNSSQQHMLTAASDDSSSLNHRQTDHVDPPLGNRVKIDLSSRSKQEIRDLRRKLTAELTQVRNLVKKLEAKELQLSGGYTPAAAGGGGYSHSHSQLSASLPIDNGTLKRVNSDVGSVVRHDSRPLHQLSISVMENSQGRSSDVLEKEKRTPKANQFYRNSDFLLGKDKFPPPDSGKKSKSYSGKKVGGSEGSHGFGMDKQSSQVLKSCAALLGKLMKHKHGWVFNTPVDVKKLGLHDYYTIIKHPMDLGSVKSRLNKNWYKSPREFAEDVRLTFHNAMTYNPRGQDVHIMAELLLNMFEERWAAMQREYNLNSWIEGDHEYGLPTPTSKKTPVPPPFHEMRRTLDRSESTTLPDYPTMKPAHTTSGRALVPKKPKAKEPNKRDMTYEEKQRLSMNLQSLPPEKLDNIVQIIKKRNSSLCQRDDEIEVDIDVVDTETLWELDRFVTNYKKSLSKNKKKTEVAVPAGGEPGQYDQEMNLPSAVVEAPEETKTDADEKNVSSSSPAQQEKQGDNASRSSSSGSSSSDSGSSSSGSDSDSSSASEGGRT